MRRVLSMIVVVPALLAVIGIAGCGSSAGSGDPLGSTLSYFPTDSPFVLSIATDPGSPAIKQAEAMVGRIPFAPIGEAAIISRLQQLGINYFSDIQPLFGNRLLIGLAGSTFHSGTGSRVLIAWVTKDPSALASLVKKLHFRTTRTYRGATLYSLGSASLAVDGATLLFGSSADDVTSALDRHAAGTGMTMADFSQQTAGLPANALLYAFGHLSGLLAQSHSSALRVPWVAALRGYGVAVTTSASGLSIKYEVNTAGSTLAAQELPLANGAAPPSLVGDMPIQVALRDPAATVGFVLQAVQASEPKKYAADLAAINAVRRRTGVDLQRDVLGQLGQNMALESDGHVFLVRVDVVDPAAAARTLHKLGTSALDVLGSHAGATVSQGPGGFETVRHPGHPSVLFGLVGSEFVAGEATSAQLRAFANAAATPAVGAQGAVAFRIALPQLLGVLLGRVTGGIAQSQSAIAKQLLGVLGDVTGWLAASPSGLTGSATLALR